MIPPHVNPHVLRTIRTERDYEPLPTPNLSHLTRTDYERVYEPAEDTFLLLDALEHDALELKAAKPLICLEIGSGSGCVSSFVGSIVGRSAALYLCTDINPHASCCTLATGAKNNVPLDAITTSLADPFLSRLKGSIDIIVFNPPYVPTTAQEVSEAQAAASIEGSWAGGVDGMQVTNLSLPQIKSLLAPTGRCYLVALAQNNIEKIREKLLMEYDLVCPVIWDSRAGGEHLFVLRFEYFT